MQSRAMMLLVRCRVRPHCSPLPSIAASSATLPSMRQSCPLMLASSRGFAEGARHFSFIKEVMDQVKKDMEADEKLKKDWERVEKTAEKVKQRSAEQEERLRSFGGSMQRVSDWTSETLDRFKQGAKEATEQNESLRKAADTARKGFEAGAESSRTVLNKSKGVFDQVMDSTKRATSYFESDKAEKHRKWKETRSSMAAAAEEQAQAKANGTEAPEAGASPGTEARADGASATDAAAAEQQPADALVVSDRGSSSWDRFGAGLRDMPFLRNLYENPLFSQLLGESEIAAAIREMKEIDIGFRLEDFAEEIEYVVAPHVVQNYLDGEAEALQMHLSESAFKAVNASITARRKQKLSLDTNVLAGPKEVELKGAQCMESGAPCFIWTFNTQQVNCLRDAKDEIVEGAVDDIRTVYYAMVVTRHPNLEELSLEYPWQITELAIVGNQTSW